MKKALYAFATLLLLATATAYALLSSSVEKPVLFGEINEVHTEFEDRPRTYLLYTPTKVSSPETLVFVLHGSIGTGENIRKRTQYGFDLLADQHGFRVVYPDGFDKHWNDCRLSADYAAKQLDINDVGFLKRIASDLAVQEQPPKNIFVAGFSNGGHLAFKLAQEHPDWVSAIAAISANVPSADNNGCTHQASTVPALIMNGTDDPINPYQGGTVSLFGLGDRGQALSTRESLSYLANQNNKLDSLPSGSSQTIGDVLIERWNINNQLFQSVTVHHGGHTIPGTHGTMPRLLGPTNHDIEASAVIWEFFNRSRKG